MLRFCRCQTFSKFSFQRTYVKHAFNSITKIFILLALYYSLVSRVCCFNFATCEMLNIVLFLYCEIFLKVYYSDERLICLKLFYRLASSYKFFIHVLIAKFNSDIWFLVNDCLSSSRYLKTAKFNISISLFTNIFILLFTLFTAVICIINLTISCFIVLC